jgi:hypothetical protein
MRRSGIVASGSTVLDAGVILAEGEEKSVKAEDLILIKKTSCQLPLKQIDLFRKQSDLPNLRSIEGS